MYPRILKLVWHHVIDAQDDFAHSYGELKKPGDCYCEPEIDKLGCDAMGLEHRVVRHQDMRRTNEGR